MAGENQITGILNKYGSMISAEVVDAIQSKPLTVYGVANASGRLKSSVHYDIKDAVMRVYALDYIYYLEHGRAGGKKPPRKVIRDWLDVKPAFSGLDAKKKDSIAYLIQRKIGEQGTTIYKQGGSKLLEDILNDEVRNEIQNQVLGLFRNAVVTKMRSAIVGK